MKKLHLYLLLTLMAQVGQEARAMEAAPEEEISEEEGEEEQEESLQEEGVYFGADEPMKDVSAHQKNPTIDQIVEEIKQCFESSLPAEYLKETLLPSIPKEAVEQVLEKIKMWFASRIKREGPNRAESDEAAFSEFEKTMTLLDWASENVENNITKKEIYSGNEFILDNGHVFFLKNHLIELMRESFSGYLFSEYQDESEGKWVWRQSVEILCKSKDIHKECLETAMKEILKDISDEQWGCWRHITKIYDLLEILKKNHIFIGFHKIFDENKREIILKNVSNTILEKCAKLDRSAGQYWKSIRAFPFEWGKTAVQRALINMSGEQGYKAVREMNCFLDIFEENEKNKIFRDFDTLDCIASDSQQIANKAKKEMIIDSISNAILKNRSNVEKNERPEELYAFPQEWLEKIRKCIEMKLDQGLYNEEIIATNLSNSILKDFRNISNILDWKKRWIFSQKLLKKVAINLTDQLNKHLSFRKLTPHVFLGGSGIDLVEGYKNFSMEFLYQEAFQEKSKFLENFSQEENPVYKFCDQIPLIKSRDPLSPHIPFYVKGEILGGALKKMTPKEWGLMGKNVKIFHDCWNKDITAFLEKGKKDNKELAKEMGVKKLEKNPLKIVEKL